jgi:hypothetical protein
VGLDLERLLMQVDLGYLVDLDASTKALGLLPQ